MSEPHDPEKVSLEARLQRLQQGLHERRKKPGEEDRGGSTAGDFGRAYALAFRYLSEFIAGVLAGVVIGWVIDQAASSEPFGLIAGVILGTITGFWNIVRLSASQNRSSPPPPKNGNPR